MQKAEIVVGNEYAIRERRLAGAPASQPGSGWRVSGQLARGVHQPCNRGVRGPCPRNLQPCVRKGTGEDGAERWGHLRCSTSSRTGLATTM